MRKKYTYKDSILLKKFPIRQQKYNYDCANSVFWTILYYFDKKVNYNTTKTLLKTDPIEGTQIHNLEKTLKKFRINFIAENSTIPKLRKYIFNNCPSIVLIQHRKETNKEWSKTWKNGHYIVILGFYKNKVVFMDPYYGKLRNLTIRDFLKRWHDKSEDKIYKKYAIICFPKNKR